jgi:hypothetical protein
VKFLLFWIVRISWFRFICVCLTCINQPFVLYLVSRHSLSSFWNSKSSNFPLRLNIFSSWNRLGESISYVFDMYSRRFYSPRLCYKWQSILSYWNSKSSNLPASFRSVHCIEIRCHRIYQHVKTHTPSVFYLDKSTLPFNGLKLDIVEFLGIYSFRC